MNNDVVYTAEAVFDADTPTETAMAYLRSLDSTGAVDRITITVRSSDPITTDGPSADDAPPTDREGPTDADPNDQEPTPHAVRAGSDAHTVLSTVATHESWALSDTIDAAVDDVPDDRIPSVLYSLSERGLVEKRPYDDDRRKREYRITPAGEQVLAAVE